MGDRPAITPIAIPAITSAMTKTLIMNTAMSLPVGVWEALRRGFDRIRGKLRRVAVGEAAVYPANEIYR